LALVSTGLFESFKTLLLISIGLAVDFILGSKQKTKTRKKMNSS
jgi:hypothetical protein